MANFIAYFKQGQSMNALRISDDAPKLVRIFAQFFYNQGVKSAARATIAQAREYGYALSSLEGAGSAQYTPEANQLFIETLLRAQR